MAKVMMMVMVTVCTIRFIIVPALKLDRKWNARWRISRWYKLLLAIGDAFQRLVDDLWSRNVLGRWSCIDVLDVICDDDDDAAAAAGGPWERWTL